jgi:hypothetical protein
VKPERSQQDDPARRAAPAPPSTSQCIDWYAEGQSRTVEVNGVRIVVRFIGRKGRRGRIAIEAPAGAVFSGEQSAHRSM